MYSTALLTQCQYRWNTTMPAAAIQRIRLSTNGDIPLCTSLLCVNHHNDGKFWSHPKIRVSGVEHGTRFYVLRSIYIYICIYITYIPGMYIIYTWYLVQMYSHIIYNPDYIPGI